jgi:hypothetical protein
MAMGNLGANSNSSQVWNASGEATEQTPLPETFVSNPPATSPIASQLATPTDHTSFMPGQPNAVVLRAPRMVGMRYLYARGQMRMPIMRLGADGQPYPWRSNFQPVLQGPIHDAGFNDALYQAGYPGFNLGLSFKVQQTDRSQTQAATRRNTGPKSRQPGSGVLRRIGRATGRAT